MPGNQIWSSTSWCELGLVLRVFSGIQIRKKWIQQKILGSTWSKKKLASGILGTGSVGPICQFSAGSKECKLILESESDPQCCENRWRATHKRWRFVRGHDKPIHGSSAIYFPGGLEKLLPTLGVWGFFGFFSSSFSRKIRKYIIPQYHRVVTQRWKKTQSERMKVRIPDWKSTKMELVLPHVRPIFLVFVTRNIIAVVCVGM